MEKRKKILLIDDEENFCFFAKRNLEQRGEFEVIATTDGGKGILLAKTENPDLILLDVAMPRISGPDVADELVQDARTRHIPYIFLTAIVTEEELGIDAPSEIGGHNFISKPVPMDKLIRCIKMVLEKGAAA